MGFEPTRPIDRGILSPLRLPFRQSGNALRYKKQVNLLRGFTRFRDLLTSRSDRYLMSRLVISSIVPEVFIRPVAGSSFISMSSIA